MSKSVIDDRISALFPDKSTTRDLAHEKTTKAPEGATTGAGVGGVVGGIAGALIGMGIPELEAKRYEGKIKDRNTVCRAPRMRLERVRGVLPPQYEGAGGRGMPPVDVLPSSDAPLRPGSFGCEPEIPRPDDGRLCPPRADSRGAWGWTRRHHTGPHKGDQLMNRITRSIALTGMVGSLALVACDNTNTQRSDNATPMDRSAPLSTDANRSSTLGMDADRSVRGNETTAMDQSNSSEHIDITARIRRAVMEDDALSTRAKNGTIVTDGTGTVTLRGHVQSQAERDAVEAKAVAVVGSGRIVNQLVVNP